MHLLAAGVRFEPKRQGVFDNKSLIINSAWVERTDIGCFSDAFSFGTHNHGRGFHGVARW